MNDLVVGCKLNVQKDSTTTIRVEILSIKPASLGAEASIYVHYDGYNKRLDEWIPAHKLILNDIEFPQKKKPVPPSSQFKKRKTTETAFHTPIQLSQTIDQEMEPSSTFSKEDELAELRVQGSLTQSHTEIARLKNIDYIIMGKSKVAAWYFSPYALSEGDLHVCEGCLEGVCDDRRFARHRVYPTYIDLTLEEKCTLKNPPGNEIYRKDSISFWELDGRKQRTYSRNLCLLSKLFLDHKTLYYDVDPFLFYVMTVCDKYGHHVIGYFSKEKQSNEDYNVACILTLPQYQRMGYGKLLIQFSYELSKVEKKVGSPEKPLSDLGLLSYRSYWADILLEILYQTPKGNEISVHDISQQTSITPDDILHTLNTLDLIKVYKSAYIIVLSDKNVEYWEKNREKKGRVLIDGGKLEWTPPKFHPSQLRYI